MMCLDSDILVALLRNNPEANAAIKRFEEEDILVTTSISSFELFNGALLSSSPQENHREAKSLLSRLEVLSFGQREAEVVSEIQADLMKKGKQVAIKDLFIAGIALVAKAPVVTRNVKDFKRIPSLDLIKW